MQVNKILLKKEEVVQAWDEGIKNPLKDFAYVRKDVKRRKRVVTPACLVESYPFKASDIVSEKKYADLNITEVILKNDYVFFSVRQMMKVNPFL